MFESSYISLDKNALRENLRYIKSLLNPGVKYCSVVKGNAYGHGLVPFVKIAMDEGVDYFAVHAVEEAALLCDKISNPPTIFIMGFVEGKSLQWAVENNIEFAVYDIERLAQAIATSKLCGKPARIHIELETGMQRTGFSQADLPIVVRALKENKNQLIFQGLFTHFAGAESIINHFRVQAQEKIYLDSAKFFEKNSLSPIYKHIACSAALLNYNHTQQNMVRIGILQYGFWPNEETKQRVNNKSNNLSNLARVISWKTEIMAINFLEKGTLIGYGNSYCAENNMAVAVIPVGYAHGYARNLSNVGTVLINGKGAPIIGIINMNSLTVDVTNCGNVVKGDEVVLIGNQQDNAISVSSFSEQSRLLNYELLTRLPLNIPRKIID